MCFMLKSKIILAECESKNKKKTFKRQLKSGNQYI